MGTVKVELFEYALFINHNKGMTVIFPEQNHVLTVEGPNGTLLVTRGADMEMMGPGGAPLAAAAPVESPGYGQYVSTCRRQWARTRLQSRRRFDPSAPVNPRSTDGCF
jgi:hypothetical protein